MAVSGGVVVHIRGLDSLIAKLGPGLIRGPARNFLNRGGIVVQSESRKLAPVDRGQLRNRISTEFDQAAMPLWVRIGPNVGVYGIAQELGTRPFWPPDAPLQAWGARHGLTPQQVFLVRRAISRRGIKPKHYMRDGLNATIPKIPALVAVMAREIEAKASGGI